MDKAERQDAIKTLERCATLAVEGRKDEDAARCVSMTRGVTLNLDGDMRLVSATIIPHKIRERDRLMSIVGIGNDSKRDVAARHDDYLAEISPHGGDGGW